MFGLEGVNIIHIPLKCFFGLIFFFMCIIMLEFVLGVSEWLILDILRGSLIREETCSQALLCFFPARDLNFGTWVQLPLSCECLICVFVSCTWFADREDVVCEQYNGCDLGWRSSQAATAAWCGGATACSSCAAAGEVAVAVVTFSACAWVPQEQAVRDTPWGGKPKNHLVLDVVFWWWKPPAASAAAAAAGNEVD